MDLVNEPFAASYDRKKTMNEKKNQRSAITSYYKILQLLALQTILKVDKKLAPVPGFITYFLLRFPRFFRSLSFSNTSCEENTSRKRLELLSKLACWSLKVVESFIYT